MVLLVHDPVCVLEWILWKYVQVSLASSMVVIALLTLSVVALAMGYGPSNVEPHEAEKAGMIMVRGHPPPHPLRAPINSCCPLAAE